MLCLQPSNTLLRFMTEIEMFEQFRKAYLGTKRGLTTEFEFFKKKTKDWKDVLPLLTPALIHQTEVRRRKSAHGEFVPYWKNLKTWIGNRCWEEEEGTVSNAVPVRARDFFNN